MYSVNTDVMHRVIGTVNFSRDIWACCFGLMAAVVLIMRKT